MTKVENNARYDGAAARVEESLPLRDDSTPRGDKYLAELELLSGLAADYSIVAGYDQTAHVWNEHNTKSFSREAGYKPLQGKRDYFRQRRACFSIGSESKPGIEHRRQPGLGDLLNPAV